MRTFFAGKRRQGIGNVGKHVEKVAFFRVDDFMPFGEELFVGVGARTGDTGLKYSSSTDEVRQKFTGYPKDTETSLDFAEARMYENRYGRLTSVDPLMSSANPTRPQSFNRYVYCLNRPSSYVDRNGEFPTEIHNEFLADAFPGLTASQLKMMQYGSALVDTSLGTGGIIQFGSYGSLPYRNFMTLDFPRTMNPSEAYKHAMIPPGKSREEAISMANDFIAENINRASSEQRSYDAFGSAISYSALMYFGMAAHTMMDGFSPTHRFFQPYTIPYRSSNSGSFYDGKVGDTGYGGQYLDFSNLASENLKHRQGGSTYTPDE